MSDDVNTSIQEFERSRIQLSAIENQTQSMKIQSQVISEALDELKSSKEEKVYKAVGNILILTDAKKVSKDLEEQKETIDLRAKTLKKQEENLMGKLNKLKTEIEKAQTGNEGKKEGK
ncbi:MAG: prefoldin subunit [archaeon]|nr:prefoldin subunit [archaeon]